MRLRRRRLLGLAGRAAAGMVVWRQLHGPRGAWGRAEGVKAMAQGAAGVSELTIEWLGHAAFVLTYAGVRIVTDPFPPTMGYPPIRREAEVVTVSHEHFDHNHVQSVLGNPRVLRGLAGGDWNPVDETIHGVRLRALPSYHDDRQGRARGKNAIFVLEFGGLKVVHLGDLGHPLGAAPQTARADDLSPVDVLLVPVGGHFTIDARVADAVARELQARVVVPMHFRTPAVADWPIETEEPFLKLRREVRRPGRWAVVSRSGLPATPQTWVFAYPAATG